MSDPAVGRLPVPGSYRQELPGARRVGPALPDETVDVTVLLRRRTDGGGAAGGVASRAIAAAEGPLEQRTFVSRDQFADALGADPADVRRVEQFAHDHGLTVAAESLERRTVELTGTVAAMSEAFGVDLHRYETPDGRSFRGRVGEVTVPAELRPAVVAVLGLDNRPQASTRFRTVESVAAAAVVASYAPNQLAHLYQFPAGLDGAGQTAAIIELGGGYRPADLSAYFTKLGLPVPNVVAVGVDRAANAPTGDPRGPDGEVLLDIEVIGAIAPAARVVVYFGPNTTNGFYDAISTAVHDRVHAPSVVSISWGGPESTWTVQSMDAYEQLFSDAAVLGVTVCCASGDSGSSDAVSDNLQHVDFPASAPHALGCGGTRVEAGTSGITREVAWNNGAGRGATGGGVSDQFPLPDYQRSAGVPPSANPGGHVGRGVPDVSGDADPETGYQVRVDGSDQVFGGTSAVAPLWAALVLLAVQRSGRAVGWLNPVLYQRLAGTGAVRDIVSGDNGAYRAGPGWDACTGLGSPNGAALVQALTPAGT